MRRLVLFVTLGAALAIAALACGPSNDKPPLTPDSEHPSDTAEAGAPTTTTPSATPATPPAK